MRKMRTTVWASSALSTVLLLAGCGGDGGGSTTTTSSSSPKISGVVTVSGSAAKPAFKGVGGAPQGKPGSAMYKASLGKGNGAYDFLPSVPARKGFSDAEVFLFDADHPEWKAPVAITTTDSAGAYALNLYENAADNGNAYADGATLADGHYTLIASKYDPTLGTTLVAIQSVAQDVAGSVSGNDLEAVPSDVDPIVDTMFGQDKNTDGTETWGDTTIEIASNGKIQVKFNMPMARDTVVGSADGTTTLPGIVLSPTTAGEWEMSPDWTTATFRPTTSLTAGTYTVTVKGDDSYKSKAVKNVYGNRLEYTAVGTFTALAAVDSTGPTVTVPTGSWSGTSVDAATSFTIESNELLDLSRMTLDMTPSLGSKPQVTLKSFDGTTYVYELVTADPLELGTQYVGSLTGIKDLAGNAANTGSPVTVAFTTAGGVAALTGLTLSSDAATLDIQIAVADLFSKWIGAMNEYDIGKWQGLTAGSFIMDYNLSEGFDDADVNRDGMYDLNEFSKMLKDKAFPTWKQCHITLTGTIDTTSLNVDPANKTADFAFSLTGTGDGGRDCSEATPKDTMYATVRKISGYWKVEHASVGIDTRGQSIGSVSAMTLVGPAEDSVMADNQNGPPSFRHATLANDGTAFAAQGDPLKFEWNAYPGASAYVFIVMDASNPENGMALAMPGDATKLDFSDPNAMPDGGGGGGGGNGGTGGSSTSTSPNYPVSEEFGFSDKFEPGAGSTLVWQIAALGSNTVAQIKQGTNSKLSKDLLAISMMQRILIGGVNTSTKLALKAQTGAGDTSPYDSSVPYNVNYRGFDITGVATHTGMVEITLTSESLKPLENVSYVETCDMSGCTTTTDTVGPHVNSDNIGRVWMDGAFRGEFPLDFDPDTNGSVVATTRTATDIDPDAATPTVTVYQYSVTITVQLTKGWNHFSMLDHARPCPGDTTGSCFNGGQGSHWRDFNINTTNGITPPLGVDSVTGNTVEVGGTGNSPSALSKDGWEFYNAGNTPVTGVKSITVAGTIDGTLTGVTQLEVNLWNNELMINKHVSVPVSDIDSNLANGIQFSFDMDIYHGDNWINIGGQACGFGGVNQWENCRWLNSNFGVRTDTGAVYVPPIAILSVKDATNASTTLTATDNFGNYQRYDASSITSNKLVITGTMTNFSDPNPNDSWDQRPMYNVGSEGGWMGGNLAIDSAGNFSLTVELFNGYNNVSFSDTAFNWMGMEIYTSLGKTVIKPTITTVSPGTFTAGTNGQLGAINAGSACYVTINGTAKQGEVRVAWRAFDDGGTPNNYMDDQYYWEEQTVKAGNPTLGDDGVAHSFSATIPVVGGTAQNNVDIMDSSWIWAGSTVKTTGTCAYVAPSVTVDKIATATDTTGMSLTGQTFTNYPTSGTITDNAVTITGTSNRPGRALRLENHVCGATDVTYVNAGTTANGSGTYDWTSNVTVYKGNQNINVMDGWSQLVNVNVSVDQNSTSATSPTAAISVTGITGLDGVDTGNAVTITPPMDLTTSCGYSNWDVGAAKTITVSGKTKSASTKLTVFINGSSSDITSDVNGDFMFTAHPYNGWNNIGINDANWNWYGMSVNTTNGVQAPKFMEVVSVTVAGTSYMDNFGNPVNITAGTYTDTDGNATSNLDSLPAGPGSVSVTGRIYANAIDNSATSAYKPDGIGASFCDSAGCTNYSTDPNAAQWGNLPMTLVNNGDGTYDVTFTATLHDETGGSSTAVPAMGFINFYSWGPSGGHGVSIGLNSSNAWSYKPGQKPKVDVRRQQNLIADIKRAQAHSH